MEQSNGIALKSKIISLLEAARARRSFADCQDIFGDPAFEILLALRLFQDKGLEGFDSVILSVDLPEENIIRWLTVLENAGLVDRNVKSIRLTGRALSILETALIIVGRSC